MSTGRMASVAGIFLLACGAWYLLGRTTELRTYTSSGNLGPQVEAMWGTPLVQPAPTFSVEIPGANQVRWVMPVRNDIEVSLKADYRRKGLLWYSTYVSAFQGTYTIENTEEVAQKVRIHFEFPAQGGTYDAFAASVDGEKLSQAVDTREGVNEMIALAPGQSAGFQVKYTTRGLGSWRYALDPNAGRVQNLDLAVRTDFEEVDYPDGCLSPMSAEPAEKGGKLLRWQATDLITKQGIGVILPEKINPGPLTARITFFAPVCLLFFFVLVATINILYRVDIHPMHYLFVAAGFFAFHLLFAYLVDVINVHLAFLAAAVISVFLVTSYLSGALRGKFPWKVAAGGQSFYLVLFSYSFFLKGITGLTVAIGSVVTLAVLMRVTAHVNWNEVFVRKPRKVKAAPPELPEQAMPRA